MSGIWASGEADPSYSNNLTNFNNANLAEKQRDTPQQRDFYGRLIGPSNPGPPGRQDFNNQTYKPAADYLGGVVNGTGTTSAQQAGQVQQGLLNAANKAQAASTRGGVGMGNAAKNAQTASASSGISGNVAQNAATERGQAAGALGGLGYTYGTNQLQAQNLQQQQAIDPSLLQLGMRSQDQQQQQIGQQNTSELLGGISGMAAGAAMASDEGLKENIRKVGVNELLRMHKEKKTGR